MATFTTDLSDFLIPKITGYVQDFGTMKENGGLTTQEVNHNIMYPLLAQRGFLVTENSDTTVVACDRKFTITEPNITLTIGDGLDGVKIGILNRSGGEATIRINGIAEVINDTNYKEFVWNGEIWDTFKYVCVWG